MKGEQAIFLEVWIATVKGEQAIFLEVWIATVKGEQAIFLEVWIATVKGEQAIFLEVWIATVKKIYGHNHMVVSCSRTLATVSQSPSNKRPLSYASNSKMTFFTEILG